MTRSLEFGMIGYGPDIKKTGLYGRTGTDSKAPKLSFWLWLGLGVAKRLESSDLSLETEITRLGVLELGLWLDL